MAATNTLNLGIIVDTSDGNSRIQAFNKSLESIGTTGEDAGKRLANGLSHGVSSVQATSAALRVLEGNMQNNLRAAERFLANTLSLGPALQAAFPVVGAVALGGVLAQLVTHAQNAYQWFKNMAELPDKIKLGFTDLNQTLRLSNDQLMVTNDRLANEIAKLEHKPQNGLKLALDEARLSADSLANALEQDLTKSQELLTKNAVGGFSGFIFSKQPTEDIADRAKRLRNELDQISINTANAIQGTNDPTKQAEIFVQATEQRKQAIIGLRQELQKELDVAQKLQNGQLDQRPIGQNGPLNGGFIAPGPHSNDQSARIEQLRGFLANLSDQIVRFDETTKGEVLKKQKDILDSEKQGANARLEIEKQAADALAHALESEGGEMAKIVETFNQRMAEMQQKGVKSFQAVSDYFKAMQIEVAEEQKKEMAAVLKAREEAEQLADERFTKQIGSNGDYFGQVQQRLMESATKVSGYQEEMLQQSEQAQLKSLDSLDAKTLEQKLWVEQQKLAIEQDYLQKSEALQIAKLEDERAVALNEAQTRAQKQLDGAGMDQDQQRRINDSWAADQSGINMQYDAAVQQIQNKTSAQQQDMVSQAAKAQTQVIQQEYQSTYDQILHFTDSFLSTIEDKTTNTWKRIADNLKKTFESILNNFIASSVASTITGMLFPGMSAGGTGKQGGFAMPAGAGAHMPGGVFGSLLNGGVFGGGTPGGTSGFSGPVNFSAGGGSSPISFLGGGSGGGTWDYSAGASAVTNGGGSGDFPAPADIGMAGVLASMGIGPSVFGGGSAIGPGGTAPFAPGGISLGGGSPIMHASMGGYGGGSGSYGGGASGGGNPLGGLLGMITGKGGNGGLLSGGNWGNAIGSLAMMAGSGMLLKGAFNPALAGTTSGTVNTLGGGALTGYGVANQIAPGTGAIGAEAGLGIGMMINGSERGNLTGMLESTGGGALAGYSIGSMFGVGPIGALVGAGAGLISGIVGMFVQNSTDKVKQAVKQAYGLTISDSTAQAIYKIAQQSYGGSIPLAVSSAQVRSMLAMLSQATGQGNGSQIYSQPVGYSFADAGGSAYVVPGTVDGTAAAAYGGVAPQTSAGLTPGQSLGSAPGSPTLLQLDGPATTALFNGQIASSAPGAVSSSLLASNNRIGTSATLFQPGLVSGPPA